MSIRDTVTGVQHVGIPTTDLEGTIAYYERLGFECLGIYPNGEDRCTFLRLNNLTLEVWTMDPTPMENGAINHFALDSTDIEASFAEAQKLGRTSRKAPSSTSTPSGATASVTSTYWARTTRSSNSAKSCNTLMEPGNRTITIH